MGSVQGYHGLILASGLYGASLGGALYSLKMLALERLRAKHFARSWALVQAAEALPILLGVPLTGKPRFFQIYFFRLLSYLFVKCYYSLYSNLPIIIIHTHICIFRKIEIEHFSIIEQNDSFYILKRIVVLINKYILSNNR